MAKGKVSETLSKFLDEAELSMIADRVIKLMPGVGIKKIVRTVSMTAQVEPEIIERFFADRPDVARKIVSAEIQNKLYTEYCALSAAEKDYEHALKVLERTDAAEWKPRSGVDLTAQVTSTCTIVADESKL